MPGVPLVETKIPSEGPQSGPVYRIAYDSFFSRVSCTQFFSLLVGNRDPPRWYSVGPDLVCIGGLVDEGLASR